jgi:outer membrane protein assembly factor BamB
VGGGYSGLTISGERIYTMGDLDNASRVLALNLADGQVVWATKLGKAGAPGWGGFAGPRSSVSFADGRLYALGQYGEFICLDAASGKEIWRKHFTQDFGAPFPEWGYSESPLVDGSQVVVTPGGDQGAIVALDKVTGEVRWRTRDFTDAAHYSSLVIANFGGAKQYVQLTANSVVGVNPEGKLLWKAPRKGQTAVIPTPIVTADLVYVTSGYNIGCNLFKISKNSDTFQAEEVYANKVMINHHGGVILLDNHVYGYSDGKGWTCQDLKTGAAAWQENDKLGKGSLFYADGHFYLRKEDGKGTVVLLEASAAGFKEKSRFDQPDRTGKNSWTHPIIVNGRLYLRDQDLLLCYDIKQK